LQLHQRGQLVYTRRAPAGPKIQNDNLPPKLVQADPAIGILNREFRCGTVDPRRFRAAIAGGADENQRQEKTGADKTHLDIIAKLKRVGLADCRSGIVVVLSSE